MPVAEVLSPSRFSVGDDDLCATRVAVRKTSGNILRVYPCHTYWPEPGMTVVNEAGRPVGRLESLAGDIRMMNKQIITAFFRNNKSKTFLLTEPFYCTFCHLFFSLGQTGL